MELTIAHDYFTQRGGAERVAALLIAKLNPARIATALYEKDRTFALPQQPAVETSFLQRFHSLRKEPRLALLAFPLAWRLMPPVESGVMLCSSSGWSHSLRSRPGVRKVIYCHNPARWLYQPDDYFRGQKSLIKWVVSLVSPLLRHWDMSVAQVADLYIANSHAVAERILQAYGKTAIVIPPPISIDIQGEQSALPGLKAGYFLTVARGRGYKNVDTVLEAFQDCPDERLVVVGDQPASTAVQANVTFTGEVSDASLRWLYANARALVSVSREDFGLTPLEANAFGTPALLLRAGGFLDSLKEGVSGEYVAEASPQAVARAVQTFPHVWDTSLIKEHAASFSPEIFIRRITDCLQEPAVERFN